MGAAAISRFTDAGHTEISQENVDEVLADISTQEPFAQHAALAYRLTFFDAGGYAEAMTADILVATREHRVGIAWGTDADWTDILDACDLTTEAGGDSFAAALRAAIVAWQVGDEADDLICTADIAELAGVQPNTVQAWTERHANFPQPVRTFGTTRVWRLGDVAVWLSVPRPSGRPRREPVEER